MPWRWAGMRGSSRKSYEVQTLARYPGKRQSFTGFWVASLWRGEFPAPSAGLNHLTKCFAVGVLTHEAGIEDMPRITGESCHPAEWADGGASFVLHAHVLVSTTRNRA